MDKLNGNSSPLATMPDANENFNRAFQNTATSMNLPQKLYMEALMNKVNFAKATNPVNTDLITKMLMLQNQGLDGAKAFAGAGGGQPGQNGSDMMRSQPGAPSPQGVRLPPGAPQGIQMPPQAPPMPAAAPQLPAAMGGGDLQNSPGVAPTSAPASTDDLHGEDLLNNLQQRVAQAAAPTGPRPIYAGSPTAVQDMANGLDLRSIPSQATEDILKVASSASANQNRYLGGAYIRNADTTQTNETKKEIAHETNETKKEVAQTRATTTKQPKAPTDKDRAQIFKETFDQYIKDPYLIQPGASAGVVAAIDSVTDPDVKKRALANPTWAKLYNQAHPPAAAAPGNNGVVTPNKQFSADDYISGARQTALAKGYQQVPDPVTGKMRPTLPIGVATRVKQALISKGVPLPKATQFINEFVLTPGDR